MRVPTKLGDIADIFVGLQTSADDVFVMNLVKRGRIIMKLRSKSLDTDRVLEANICFPLVSGTDVNGYAPLPERQFILFPYEVKDETATLIPFDALSRRFPKAAAYLIENKARLEQRERGKFKDRNWYRFGRSQNLGIQRRPKLCVPRLVETLHAAYDKNGTHFLDNVDVGGVTLKQQHAEQLPYLQALLNSKLLGWLFPSVSAPFRGGWRSANRQFLSQLPIRTIRFTDPADKDRHDRMVSLVERMLALHKQLAAAKTAHAKTNVQRQIDATDAQINTLVYQLYGLSPDEITLAQGAAV